jgi:hypothetical protein
VGDCKLSKENTERTNQAEQLKKIFDELQQGENNPDELMNDQFSETDSIPKIDVLNLPPRKEIHGNKKSRIRLSMSKPFLRLLSVIFLIILIICGAYYIWGEELIHIINNLK